MCEANAFGKPLTQAPSDTRLDHVNRPTTPMSGLQTQDATTHCGLKGADDE